MTTLKETRTDQLLRAGVTSIDVWADALRQTESEIAALRIAFAHYHVNYGDGSDTCKQCGLDLRDPVHFTEYRDKQIAKYAARRKP